MNSQHKQHIILMAASNSLSNETKNIDMRYCLFV